MVCVHVSILDLVKIRLLVNSMTHDSPAVEIAECCQSEDDVARLGDDTDTDSSSKSVSFLQFPRKRIQ